MRADERPGRTDGRKGGPIKGAMKHVDYVSGVVAEEYHGGRGRLAGATERRSGGLVEWISIVCRTRDQEVKISGKFDNSPPLYGMYGHIGAVAVTAVYGEREKENKWIFLCASFRGIYRTVTTDDLVWMTANIVLQNRG